VKPKHAQEFTEALGQVIGGAVRLADVATEMGVPEALGLTQEEWAQRRLAGHVRLSIPERRQVVGELTAQGRSSREIGEALGVDHATVLNDRRGAGENSPAAQDEEPTDVADPGENSPPSNGRRSDVVVHVTLAIADAIRYLDRPPDHATKVAAMFDPDEAGIGREEWTVERFNRAGIFLAALTEALEGVRQ
jgi:hypothetical protein